ncbi:Permease of the major facilitator superfamily [Leuconostoc gasicomitatum]|nr:Permease of the major facilitator superfamily [Leuconostoc gasicomitatum]
MVITILLVFIAMLVVINSEKLKLNSIVLITAVVTSIIVILISSLVNKVLIFVAQLGQSTNQKVTFLQSWHATVVSQLPFSVVNLFCLVVLNLYKSGNDIANIISAIIGAILYTAILKNNNLITNKTQYIYIGIAVVLAVISANIL